jgi:hypothetical protein
MTIVNLSFDSYDFKQIAETVSTIRVAGHGLGLIGILISYFTIYKPAPKCSVLTNLPCDTPRYIFYIFAAIYASGLIGLPWDVLVLWAKQSIANNSSVFQETYFQVMVFGFLALNISLIALGDEYIEAIIFLNQWYDDYLWDPPRDKSINLLKVLRHSILYSIVADLILIPQLIQLASTVSYSYFVYQNQPGV